MTERIMQMTLRAWLKTVAAVVTVVAALLMLTGCGANNTRDQENIKSWDADYSETYTNGDGFPNTTLQCIRGAGVATTTRDLNAWQRVPAWDEFCKQFKQHPVDWSQVRKNG